VKRIWIIALACAAAQAACLGNNGLTSKVREFNLEVVENRWAREGVFVGMHALWIYRVTAALDLLVLNPVEFWSGSNPINGKSALAALPRAEVDGIASATIERAELELVSEDDARLRVEFSNGDRVTFAVVRSGDAVQLRYLDRTFFEAPLQSGSERGVLP
jgi:hypothetical protein